MEEKSELETSTLRLEPALDLLVETPRSRGAGLWLALSILLHAGIVMFILTRPVAVERKQEVPMTRYVELMRQLPFEEAPGRRVDRAPLDAPFSNANRKASTPNPTGDKPTRRPGDGGIYVPGVSVAPSRQASAAAAQRVPRSAPAGQAAFNSTANSRTTIPAYDQRAEATQASAAAQGQIDWKSAIREVGRVASLGGQGEVPGSMGGDPGFAESGPVSFETQWYDWGDYAQGMIGRIRANWYANMPPLIRLGMKGVVVIRFTIQRSGAITDVTILRSSNIPPYDFAARKAIELSSPLAQLPANFPNQQERVTAGFYYNLRPPHE